MARSPFSVSSPFPILARIPSLPAYGNMPSDDVNGLVREGVFLASRHVSRDLDRVTGELNALSRLGVTQQGYEIRARYRPVPHGVFAGVALARFAMPGEDPVLAIRDRHRARTNPSAAWLTALRDQLLSDATTVSGLLLSTNNLVIRRGARLIHERPTGNGAPPERVSIRATAVTDFVMTLCKDGSAFEEIVASVAQRWPVDAQVIRCLLLSLVRDGFLVDDLLPLDLADDPLWHVLGRIIESHDLRRPLARLRSVLGEADERVPGDPQRLRMLRQARDLADGICLVERPLTADLAADAQLVLPASLGVEAATAANVLWRLADERDPLTAYHERFVERYGVGRLVPVLEATDPAVGLDIGVVDAEPARTSRHRAALMTELLARAASTGGYEVQLDNSDVAALTRAEQDGAPRTAEITVRVVATAQDSAARGFHLAVCPVGLPDAGTALGRFASLLHPSGQDVDNHALVAEVVAASRLAEGGTLVPPTGLAAWRIPIGVAAAPDDLSLDDLLLCSDGHRLVLWSSHHDRQVIPVSYSRLSSRLLPPLARFLRQLGRTGRRAVQSWSWTPADAVPFTPRVRYQRIILAPARWLLHGALVNAASDASAWSDALCRWRVETTPPPPGVVVVDDRDRLLPLELDRTEHRELLRRYVGRGVRAVVEPLGGTDAHQTVLPGPNGGHLLELVIPLSSRTAAPRPRPPITRLVRESGDRVHLPGGRWLSLAIRCSDSELLLP